MIADPPPIPPADGPPGGDPPPWSAAPSVPQKRPSWVQGCLIFLAGLLLAGGSCFGCLNMTHGGSDAAGAAFTVLFGIGVLACLVGFVLAIVRVVQRLSQR